MTPPDLTPEQMNEAATALDERRACERCDGTGWLMGHDPNSAHPDNPDGEYDFDCPDCKGTGLANIDEFLRVLFAAWQEQAAAKAGENPHDPSDRTYQREAWTEGAAAATAAERERWEAKRRPRITHGRHCICTPCAREDWTNPALASCGMHGRDCPQEYAPLGAAGDPVPAVDLIEKGDTDA